MCYKLQEMEGNKVEGIPLFWKVYTIITFF